MLRSDEADAWETCQALIYDAIEEIYRKQEEKDSFYEPWSGIFAPQPYEKRGRSLPTELGEHRPHFRHPFLDARDFIVQI